MITAMWHTSITDSTAAMNCDTTFNDEAPWPIEIKHANHKTTRGRNSFIDRFTYNLGSLHVFERVITSDEYYFRFMHLTDGTIYEVSSYFNAPLERSEDATGTT
jgi:hypothetical protein